MAAFFFGAVFFFLDAVFFFLDAAFFYFLRATFFFLGAPLWSAIAAIIFFVTINSDIDVFEYFF